MIDLLRGDCLELMRDIPDASIDAVITDPPYGCGKADWDDAFPTKWYKEAKCIAQTVCIITGSFGVKDSLPFVGDDFLDIIAAWNLNSLTRGNIGFNNWIACVVAGKKPRQGVNFFEFAVRGDMPNHPSPKPIEYMLKLVSRVTNPGDTILDPFMGSGTTGVACVKLNRNFIGIEINEQYFKIAEKRIADAQKQMTMDL
jgi:site-specific DNA-methyltransferase (adenine-specific)